jgi:hypothetical protein
MSDKLNPENKCAQLYNEDLYEKQKVDHLKYIFEKQLGFQKRVGKDPANMNFEERVQCLTTNWRNLTLEFSEMLERLPFKEWKTYTEEQKAGFTSKEHELETQYEWCDMLHFFVNLGIYLGIDHEKAFNLYASKIEENHNRQNNGY